MKNDVTDFQLNPSEMLDIVDENDNIIGSMGFKDVHEKGLLHRFCRVLLMNTKGQIVLQKRAKGISYAGKIDAPGGHVRSGFTYSKMACTELKEEFGIEVAESDLTLLGRIRDQKNPSYENMIGMAFLAVHDGPYILEEGEVSSVLHFEKEELFEEVAKTPEDFSPKLLETLRAYEAYIAYNNAVKK